MAAGTTTVKFPRNVAESWATTSGGEGLFVFAPEWNWIYWPPMKGEIPWGGL